MLSLLGTEEAVSESFDFENGAESYSLIRGDNIVVLEGIPSSSFDLVITSPPYFSQREYSTIGLGNEETVDEYLDNILEVFRQLVRVTKPTGSIVYNIGDKIIDGCVQLVPYRFAIKVLEDPLLKLRLVNDITWVKKNPTPHQFSRRLIASTEPFFHFALGNDYYYDRSAFLPSKNAPRRTPTKKLGNQYRKLIDSSDLNAEERSAAHTALDQAVADVWDGTIHSFRMKIRGIHAPAYGGQEGGRKMHMEKDGFTIIRISGQSLKRDVIESPVGSLPGNGHPAIFPVQVIREIIRMLCPPEGVVLDPYMGSGSSMAAALLENRSCTGIEISKEYCETALNRVSHVIENPTLL